MIRENHGYKTAKYLATGALLLTGRYIAARLVSGRWGKKLRWAPPAGRAHITCPSGNVWYAEYDGPADGRPVVFIHGINANHRQWYYQREHLRKNYRLLFLDMPMHRGESLSDRLNIPTLAADLNSVLKQLNIQNAIIYGHSMGGMVLLQYLVQYQGNSQTRAVILQGASYTNPIRTNPFAFLLKPMQQPVLVPLFKFLKKHAWFFNGLSHVNYWNGVSCLACRLILFSGHQTANQLIYATAMAPAYDAGAMAESLLQLMQYDVTRQLPNLHIPVLIISGLYDRFNTVQCNKYLHQQLPQSHLEFIAAGHQGMLENYEEVNTMLERFIEQVLEGR